MFGDGIYCTKFKKMKVPLYDDDICYDVSSAMKLPKWISKEESIQEGIYLVFNILT